MLSNISSTSAPGFTQIFAWVVHNLNIPFNQYDVSEIKKMHPHLKELDFPVLKDSDVTLIIGTDHQTYCSIEIFIKNKMENQQQ